tara:strand:+ start:48 stop:317 length:270 start_codon:yes stop_codon:yes gene_type:complete
MKFHINNLYLNQYLGFDYPQLIKINFKINTKMFYCNFKSSKEKKSYYQNKKLEMLNYIKDSLERKIASVTASIEVLEIQINRDKVETSQ